MPRLSVRWIKPGESTIIGGGHLEHANGGGACSNDGIRQVGSTDPSDTSPSRGGD